MRLDPGQVSKIRAVEELRDAAVDLRSRVASGSYGDSDLDKFLELVGKAGLILMVATPELSERAGLSKNFFQSVVRERRRPKLTNFLKALTAIIEVADERLFDVQGTRAADPTRSPTLISRLQQDGHELRLLAQSLARLARDELEKLNAERPNDPMIIEAKRKQRDLLTLFLNGFERIEKALAEFEERPGEPLLLGRAAEVVESVGRELDEWWKANGAEAVDWSVRLPVIAAGVALLGWAGANMTVATSVVAALIGGSKAINAITSRRKKAKDQTE